MSKNRLGQASVFMIIGVLVIAIATVLFYILSLDQESDQAGNYARTLEALPTQFKPVGEYLEGCLSDQSKQALVLLGQNGGYLSLIDPEFKTKQWKLTSDATESEAIQFPASSTTVPYWWHLKSPNFCQGTCTFESHRPSIEEMQTMINLYVERTINECLADFKPFVKQGFQIDTPTKISASSVIGPETVTVTLDYPLFLERDGTTGDIQGVVITHQAKLGKLYDLATDITNLQMEFRFLERHIVNLLASYSGLQGDKIPPFTELTFNVGSRLEWSKKETQLRVQQMISSHSQLFQVEGSGNYDRTLFDNQLKQRLYDQTLIPSGKPYHDLITSFAYLDFWPIYFDLNCDGDSCRPSSANSIIDGFGVQQYRFAYDISYPMLIDLADPEAFDGEGLTLRFALESNVRNNKPLPTEFRPLSTASHSSGRSTLLCNKANLQGDDVAVIVRSPAGSPVANADVMYTILGETCFLGETDEQGVLTTQFPGGVVGGAIVVSSPDVVGTSKAFTPGESGTIHVQASSLHDVSVLVEQKQVKNVAGNWIFQPNGLPLDPVHEVLLSFTRIPQDGEAKYSTLAKYRPGEELQVKLAPGTYDVDFTLFRKEHVVIPPSEQIITTGILQTETISFPGIDFGAGRSTPRYLQGGFRGQIVIPESYVTSDNQLVMYVVAPDIPQTIDDITHSQNTGHYSKVYHRSLQPTIKRS